LRDRRQKEHKGRIEDYLTGKCDMILYEDFRAVYSVYKNRVWTKERQKESQGESEKNISICKYLSSIINHSIVGQRGRRGYI